jgi:hypothetical protein
VGKKYVFAVDGPTVAIYLNIACSPKMIVIHNMKVKYKISIIYVEFI